MASQTPAELMGLPDKGKLAPGCDADIIVLDGKLQVTQTLVRGEPIYQHTISQP
jgi:N-acetylglucosamine-6-phosphate deacetylase